MHNPLFIHYTHTRAHIRTWHTHARTQDLVFHCLWVFFWFVACVDWAVSYSKLHEDVVATFNLYNGGCSDISSPKYDSTAQAAISVVSAISI